MREREQFRAQAVELVTRMTLEEKTGQLRYQATAIPRLGVPAYNWWNEALHGVARAGTATVFPQAIGMAASFDEELLRQEASAVAEEGRAKYNESVRHGDRDIYKGLTFWAPNVNIFRDPRWGRGHETYGEDPWLAARMGVAYVKGLQGNGEYLKTAACAKHFAVHSGPEGLRHSFDARVSEKDLRETYLPAFEACVKEGGVEAVMGAYNRTNGEPCCGSFRLLKEILREEWGFQGHVVSDCWAIRDFHTTHGVTETPGESVSLALKAGCDVNCGNSYEYLLESVNQGLVTEEEITEACVRLFTTRFALGMFAETEYDSIPYERVECKEFLALNERAARESMVLLKNDGILPLCADSLRTVGVIGPNADSRQALMGNYHGTSSEYITVLEGIRREVDFHNLTRPEGREIRLLYAKGCHLFRDREENLGQQDDRLAEAVTVAEHSDVVILCLGLDETLEGEQGDTGNSDASGDKQDLQLPAPQRRLLRAVLDTGKPVILCNMTGSAVDLSLAQDKAAAVLQLWYPGARGGKAAAEILFGRYSPAGKLPVTFYRSEEGLPEFTDYSMKNRTYRYYTGSPLYPFGYGLTYGKTVVTEADVEEEAEDGSLRLRVSMFNGGRETDEVLQIYCRNLGSPWAEPNPKLAAFQRILLGEGEEKTVHITVPAQAFTVVDEKGVRREEGRRFLLYAGFGQPDGRTRDLSGQSCMEISFEKKNIVQ